MVRARGGKHRSADAGNKKAEPVKAPLFEEIR